MLGCQSEVGVGGENYLSSLSSSAPNSVSQSRSWSSYNDTIDTNIRPDMTSLSILGKESTNKKFTITPLPTNTEIIEMIYFVLCIEYFLQSFLTVGLFASFQASSRFPKMFSRVFTSVSRSMLSSLPSLLSSKVSLITSLGSHRSNKDREAKVA